MSSCVLESEDHDRQGSHINGQMWTLLFKQWVPKKRKNPTKLEGREPNELLKSWLSPKPSCKFHLRGIFRRRQLSWLSTAQLYPAVEQTLINSPTTNPIKLRLPWTQGFQVSKALPRDALPLQSRVVQWLSITPVAFTWCLSQLWAALDTALSAKVSVTTLSLLMQTHNAIVGA